MAFVKYHEVCTWSVLLLSSQGVCATKPSRTLDSGLGSFTVARSLGRLSGKHSTEAKASNFEIVLCKYIKIVVAQLPLRISRVRTSLCAGSKEGFIALLLLQAQVAKL